MPASLDALPVSESVEDHAPQTPLTIRKLEEQLVPFRLLVAIEALVAAQAVDLRAGSRLAPSTEVLFDAIRGAGVPMLVEDQGHRPGCRPDGGAVRNGGFSAADRGPGRAGLTADLLLHRTACGPPPPQAKEDQSVSSSAKRSPHSGAKPAEVGAPSSKGAR